MLLPSEVILQTASLLAYSTNGHRWQKPHSFKSLFTSEGDKAQEHHVHLAAALSTDEPLTLKGIEVSVSAPRRWELRKHSPQALQKDKLITVSSVVTPAPLA